MICEDCLLHHVIRECLWDVIERKHTDTATPSQDNRARYRYDCFPVANYTLFDTATSHH
jgi:hypothetical protein